MTVHVSLFLFGKPAQELDKEGEEIEAGHVRALAGELNERLLKAADAIDRLTAHGWDATMMLYDVTLTHPYIHTEVEARGRFEDLGLNADEFCFMELEDEDDFEEEEDELEGTEYDLGEGD
jgi:hypothetical protein